MPIADLHTHSTASDGLLSPTEVVERAAEAGVTILALTDHDTTDGVAEALDAGLRIGIEVIPVIDINTEHEAGSLDILGYWIPVTPGPFQARIAELRDARVHRGQRMVEALNRLGVPVRWERVRELAQGSVGRPHVAQALVETGHVRSLGEAFDIYIGHGRPAYVPRPRFTAVEAIQFVRAHGGVPVMAHPIPAAAQHRDPFHLEDLLPRLRNAGLAGIDAYYGSYTPDTIRRLVALAGRYGLIPAGGSDFHGPAISTALGTPGVPIGSVDRLRRLRTDPKGLRDL
ncbi:MAG: PHP domain-containing protein [Anaerolineae bacterium]|nr:PHP domain-containing protein [Anaerolineae bacterium]